MRRIGIAIEAGAAPPPSLDASWITPSPLMRTRAGCRTPGANRGSSACPAGSAASVHLKPPRARARKQPKNSASHWSLRGRFPLLAISACYLVVIVGSGGCEREQSRSSRSLAPSTPSVGAEKLHCWGNFASLRGAADACEHENGSSCTRAMLSGRMLLSLYVSPVLRPRGGSDSRPMPLEQSVVARGQQREKSPPNVRHEDARRGDVDFRGSRARDGRGDRGDLREDRGDKRLWLEVGDKCASILRDLGGVSDLMGIVDRWRMLFPRNPVSRNGEVSFAAAVLLILLTAPPPNLACSRTHRCTSLY